MMKIQVLSYPEPRAGVLESVKQEDENAEFKEAGELYRCIGKIFVLNGSCTNRVEPNEQACHEKSCEECA